LLSVPRPQSATLVPYTTLFRSAAEWLYTGRVFGADEALRGGLVRSVHPADELLPAAQALAAEIAAAAPLSVALTRQMLWRMLGADRKSTRLNSSHVKNSYAASC